MGAIYFFFMMVGAFRYRLPPAGWRPEGWTPPSETKTMITQHHVHLNDAHKTPQFWLIWWVLCLNVSAGIGVIGMASPMLQEIFGGKLIGHPELGFTALSGDQKVAIAAIAAGFAGLLSLFNIGGRFFWASLSDYIGRKNTYFVFFLLGIALYASAPFFAQIGSKLLFVSAFCIILSMYGGGFATVPAYLADMFGTQFVGAIHGRLLTAWSTAGIIGPVVVNYIREAQLAAGVPRDHLYDFTMYILCAHADHRLDLQLPGQAGECQVVHERRRGREASGGQRQKHGWHGVRLVRHRQRRLGLESCSFLGLRRHTAGLGCVDSTQIRCGAVSIADIRPARAAASAAACVLRGGGHFPRPRHKPLDESRRSA